MFAECMPHAGPLEAVVDSPNAPTCMLDSRLEVHVRDIYGPSIKLSGLKGSVKDAGIVLLAI